MFFFFTRHAKASWQRCLNTPIRSFHFSILALGDTLFPLDPSHSLINKYIAFRGHLQIIRWGGGQQINGDMRENILTLGSNIDVHQEALLSYAEAVPLCVLLLCKYRPSDYTGC